MLCLGGPAAKTLGACGPEGFGLKTSLGTTLTSHHGTSSVFSNNVPMYTVHCRGDELTAPGSDLDILPFSPRSLSCVSY